ncbi:MAG: T9SS type A sorting domain-containing protein [Saprospiraceae bacterium]|nr:T9SS type A sorting domain-containing protein [Candidatus Opimibacter skivensis]
MCSLIRLINPWPHNGSPTITITDIQNPGNLDFIGIKIGDVNGTAKPDFTQLLPRESLLPFELKTDQQFYSEGDIINVPIRISSDQQLTGFQFTLAAPGMEFLHIFPGQLDVSEEHFALYNDRVSISWFDENTIDVSADDVLFTLQLRAIKSGNIGQALSINSEITEAEIYLANEETFLPVLNVHDPHAESDLQILSCAPNPWKEETIINFYMPESEQVNFTLFDISGREIFSTSSYLKKGYHQQLLKSSDFQGTGILFFQISTSDMSEITKLIVVK